MTEISIRKGLPSADIASNKLLRVARINTALFMALLYFQDVFWLVLSRVQSSIYDGFYFIAPFAWFNAFLFLALSCLFSLVAVVSVWFIRPFKRIRSPRLVLYCFILASIVLNLGIFFLVDQEARYTSGGLTGISGLIYFIGRGFGFFTMVFLARVKNLYISRFPKKLFFLFVFSYALTIDGMASALTILTFLLVVVRDLRIFRLFADVFLFKKRGVLFFLLALASFLLVWIGLSVKFGHAPDIKYVIRWAVTRFSIQAEQMYMYISGFSSIGDGADYLDLIFRAFSDRLDVVLGNSVFFDYPRNVSEAIYYDMKGAFGSGSSPGILMNTALQGWFFFVPPIFYSFIFIQFFYGFHDRISFIHLMAYSFLFKAVHTNFSEFLVVISPTVVYLFFFLVAVTLVPRRM